MKGKYEENQVKKLQLKLRDALKDKQTFRKRYLLAKKISKTNAFKIVIKKISSVAKTLFYMQVKGSGKKPRGRRFTLDEKVLASSLYKPSPKAYRLLSQLLFLPSRRTLQNTLQKVDIMPGINDKIFEHFFVPTLLFNEMSIATNLY